MDILSVAVQNLTSAPVLAFALGLLAAAIKSDLRLPEPIYQAISIYLLLGIGIKGGVALSNAEFQEVGLPILGTLLLGLTVPVLAFFLLKFLKKRKTPADNGGKTNLNHGDSVGVSSLTKSAKEQNVNGKKYRATN